jgi:phage shock protein E
LLPLRLVTLGAGLLLAAQLRAELPTNAVWIDVRSPAEYQQGHLAQAQLIPFDGIEAGVSGLNLPKDTPIYLYCAVGGRAEVAKQRLEALGYDKVTNVGSLENARELASD